jgi:hypothetical protein
MRIDVGLLSLGFGLLFPYQIGVVDGLFSTTPRWVPIDGARRATGCHLHSQGSGRRLTCINGARVNRSRLAV